ncbi:MAG TPA: carboxypeptidase regulatory-like domain-containing protein [Clostridia bacterium]
MGAKIATYSFIPKPNEQIDTVITVEEEVRSMIFGIVKDCRGKLVKDAVVKLFRAKDCDNRCLLQPITHTFTDECGQFFFGPLMPGKKYVVKVWVNDVKIVKAEENYDKMWDEVLENVTKAEIPQNNKVLVKDPEIPEKYYYK